LGVLALLPPLLSVIPPHHCLQLVVAVRREAMLLYFCDRPDMLERRRRLRRVEVDGVLTGVVTVAKVLIQTAVVLRL